MSRNRSLHQKVGRGEAEYLVPSFDECVLPSEVGSKSLPVFLTIEFDYEPKIGVVEVGPAEKPP